jgi:hypothetical protein
MTQKVSLAQFTFRLEDWASGVVSKGIDAIDSGRTTSGDKHYGPELKSSLKEKVKSSGGLPEKVTFQMPRHGVYFALGVSKGYKILEKGSGVVVKTGPGEFNRTPVDWFASPLRDNMDNLAQIIAEENARLAAEGLSLGVSTLQIRGLE